MNLSNERLYSILINEWCSTLDFIADPNIEKNIQEMDFWCGFDCHGLPSSMSFDILEGHAPDFQQIIGITGLELFQRFQMFSFLIIGYEMLDNFSKTEQWKEVSELAKRLSIHIKKSIKLHKKNNKIPSIIGAEREYSLEYTNELIEKHVEPFIGYLKKMSKHNEGFFISNNVENFLARSSCILENPDVYSGISYTLFLQLKRLYCLSNILYENDEKTKFNELLAQELQACAQKVIDIYDAKQKKI